VARKLGDILVDRGLITEADLQNALASQDEEREDLDEILMRRGLLSAQKLGETLAEQFEIPYREIIPETVNAQVIRLLPEAFARERHVVPITANHGDLTLAMASPDDLETIAEAELITGYRVEPVVAISSVIQATLDRGFDEQLVARQTVIDMKLADLIATGDVAVTDVPGVVEDDAAPVVRLVRSILLGAIHAGASDIHLEPHSPEMRVRYRIDGDLKQVMTIPKHIEEPVVARIKVMADMNTTETRRPQDGKLHVAEGTDRASMRVSTIPTTGGEKVVLRIIDDGNRAYNLDNLGLTPQQRTIVQGLLDKSHGMLVATGPTGSGKSTTLYAMLSSLNTGGCNIVTVEDPVEARLQGINQVNADNEHGLGFANALKYFMRQDPDVIMVGEIRDHETASTAVQAALTGHLLLSTLHTNDAVSAVIRLVDLGIDPFKIGGALLGSVAQRLLRSICPQCKEPYQPNETMWRSVAGHLTLPSDTVFYHGRGCKKCLGTGYAGRQAIFEIMVVTPAMTEAIERRLPLGTLRETAGREGMTDLASAGINLVLAGLTTVEEVYYKLTG
jgi:type IV pilus assembly protein PilB